ncbi:MAG: class I SAM-dependent RNA methyltransferase [Candidatus Aegiribacteria sp.]|nr:class I SAM-dependent RNA methyltransferase [Candidatus Aegiribacteria sp.]
MSSEVVVLEYQKTGRFFGMIAEDLKSIGVEELRSLGACELKMAYRGIFFQCDIETLYRINYQVRFFSRILAPIITFDCHSDRYLYSTARSIDWSLFLTPDSTFAIFSSVHDSNINHSQYAALKLKDAIADWFMDRDGRRPDIDTICPDLWIGLRIFRNRAYIRLDTSGGSMHRRGYREQSVEAPMQETLAAALVEFSGWDGSTPLYDPFCGSGTILCEALMKYCRIPSGYLRQRFGFENLPEFDREQWKILRKSINSRIRKLPEGLIAGSDISREAVNAASCNCSLLPSGDRINLKTAPYINIDELKNMTIISNPPYGLRLRSNENMGGFMKEFGDFLKQRCSGTRAWVYFGKRKLIKSMGLKSSIKIPLHNGKLDGRLVLYEMY